MAISMWLPGLQFCGFPEKSFTLPSDCLNRPGVLDLRWMSWSRGQCPRATCLVSLSLPTTSVSRSILPCGIRENYHIMHNYTVKHVWFQDSRVQIVDAISLKWWLVVYARGVAWRGAALRRSSSPQDKSFTFRRCFARSRWLEYILGR